MSASPSRSISPRSPFGRPSRSATAPIQRGPPSPEILSSNLDCAFPPFPTSKPASQNRSQQGDGYGAGNRLYAEPDPMYAPVSPRTASSGGLLQRMNTIAPGPFDVRKRPGDRPGHQRQPTAGSLRDATMSSRTADIDANIQRPATAGPGHSRSSTSSSGGFKSGTSPPRVRRMNGYGGFGPPVDADNSERETLQSENRSQTFPLPSEVRESPFRRPSEPAVRPGMHGPSKEPNGRIPLEEQRSVSGSPPRQRKASVPGPDLTRPLPPRGISLIRHRADTKPGDVPPVPSNVNLAAEFGIGNPYHTPTESQSSNASGYSEESKASSRSSPPRSNTSQSRRKPSDASKADDLMSEIQSSMADLQPRELPISSSPPRNRAKPPALDPLPKPNPFLQSPESPMDPAVQNGRLSPLLARNPARQAPLRSEPQEKPIEKPSRRPTTSKGNCKGCGEPIKGKSVSSADGRLTGRYHKQCFVCKTCSEPFQTATFYVINDAPYCEHHYHKLNGSVCTGCDKGIEGQYLESERKQKFHPGCLTCADCKRNLRNDYFEMNGRVYCERDAFRRAQQGRFLGPGAGGSNRMERRTTRLMMM